MAVAAMQEKRTHVRWFPILALVFVATAINYLNRAVFGIARPLFTQELHIDPVLGGLIASGFSWTYAAAQIPAGAFLDRFGTRFTYALSLVTWSAFTVLEGFAVSGAMLFGAYIGLGLCEAPCFPANSRILAHWFPQKERARANSVYAVGQYFNTAILAVPLFWVAATYGWRALFILTGVIGIVWGVIWYLSYREPQESKLANDAERDFIVAGGGLKHTTRTPFRWKYVGQLLSFRQVQCAAIAQFCGNTVLVFFLLDFVNYLVTQRHMAFLHAGIYAALPYLGAALGGLVGAQVADAILRNGGSVNLARKLPVVAGLLLASTITLVNLVPLGQDGLVIAIMSVAFFGQGATNLGWTVISDLAPKQLIGMTGGVFNMITNLAGILTPIILGVILKLTGTYVYSLIYVGALPLLGAFLYVFVMGDVKRLEIAE